MAQKPPAISLLAIIALILGSVAASAAPTQSTETGVSIYLGPRILIADGTSVRCIYVQLEDAKGNPRPVGEDVTVLLTSSNLEIGKVDPRITIKKGTSFASARFNTTKNGGTSVISAGAGGYGTSQAELTTLQKARESSLKVTTSPPTLPAAQGAVGYAFIQLYNPYGDPTYASKDTTIFLSSSNTTVATLKEDTVVIPRGKNYARVNIIASGTPGVAQISALSQGLSSSNSSVKTLKPGSIGKSLHLGLEPDTLLPDGQSHYSITISIRDPQGNPVKASEDILIKATTDNQPVATVDEDLIIRKGTYYTIGRVMVSAPGRTAIEVQTTGLLYSKAFLNIVGLNAIALELFVTPPRILADETSNKILTIQSLDKHGNPVPVTRDTEILLSSSSASVGVLPRRVVLKQGASYTAIPLNSTASSGATVLTASAQGLISTTGRLQTISLGFNATMTTPKNARINEIYEVQVTVTSLGEPVKDALVTWTVMGGKTSPTSLTDAKGTAKVEVTQFSDLARIKAIITKPGYDAAEVTKSVLTPSEPQAGSLNVTILGFTFSLFYLMAGLGVVIILIFGGYVYLKYWGPGAKKINL